MMPKHPTYIVAAVLLLTACGGGGGGSSSPAPIASSPPPTTGGGGTTTPPPPGFASGTFEAYETYEQQCENPRSGFDEQGNPFPDVQGSTEDENNWIRSWSNHLYLWYNEITDEDPAAYDDPLEYFDLMKTFETTPSGAPKDRFHFTIPTDEYQAQAVSGIVGGYGATFTILRGTPPRQVVVAYTEPNTPATSVEVNLMRGAEILEIDGEDLINGSDVDTLNAGLFPGDNETHTFVIQDTGSSEPRQIIMTSEQIVSTPVQNVSTLETETGLVGYMTFNDHIATSELQLIDAVNQLAPQQITDLVLDLRYNGGGFLAIANQLGYMIAGDTAVGQVFEELQFNDKHTLFDPVTGETLSPDNFRTTARGFSATPGAALPTLGLSRVFVITGPTTCSASESLINGLRGIGLDVVQVGHTTCGKPYGFYPFDNCGTTYFSIQFRGVNAQNFGDYTDGFSPANVPQQEGVEVPGCFVSDDFTNQLGDPNEGRLRAALQYREDGSCPTVVSSFGNQRAARPGPRPLSATDGETVKPLWLKSRIVTR